MTWVLLFAVLIIGWLMFMLAKPESPKVAEVGKIVFWTSLLVVLFKLSVTTLPGLFVR